MENKAKYVNAKVFNATEESFEFPEVHLPELQEKKNVGICFSGGGTRSASLTMGQIRGLQEIGVLDKIKYLAAVSGGSWGSVPFIFLDKGISDKQFLGAYIKPENLTEDDIAASPKYSLSAAISHSILFDDLIKNLFAGDERYVNIISDIFLKPFNIGNMDKFFTYNNDSLKEILKNNPRLSAGDFYKMNPQANRPFPIITGTVLRPKFGRYRFDMTPLYVGVDGLFPDAGSHHNFDIGGGYIQPLGFDSDSPSEFDKTTQVAKVRLGRKKHRFTLGDMIGTSGAAPAEYADRFGFEWLGFPEYKYWSPAEVEKTKAKEYDFGDGGIFENLGIMPMLRRGVKKLIIFVNCQTQLGYDESNNPIIASSIPALFHEIPNQNGEKNFDENIVFANQENKFKKLVKGLNDAFTKNKAAIYTDTYSVTKQDCHNIRGGSEVEIMWVYNVRIGNWVDKLPLEIRHNLETKVYGERFPNYKTFMENFPHIIDMKPEQVNLMGHQAAWSMVENKAALVKFVES